MTRKTKAIDDELLSLCQSELKKQGIRGEDGRRQFRMDSNSLLGNHNPNEPHVHLEMVAPNGRDLFNQNHLILERRND